MFLPSPVSFIQGHIHPLHDVGDGDGGGAGDPRQAVHEDTSIGGFCFLCRSQIQKRSLTTTLFSSETLFPFTHTMSFICRCKVKPLSWYLPIFPFNTLLRRQGNTISPPFSQRTEKVPHVLISKLSLIQVASYSIHFTAFFYIMYHFNYSPWV